MSELISTAAAELLQSDVTHRQDKVIATVSLHDSEMEEAFPALHGPSEIRRQIFWVDAVPQHQCAIIRRRYCQPLDDVTHIYVLCVDPDRRFDEIRSIMSETFERLEAPIPVTIVCYAGDSLLLDKFRAEFPSWSTQISLVITG